MLIMKMKLSMKNVPTADDLAPLLKVREVQERWLVITMLNMVVMTFAFIAYGKYVTDNVMSQLEVGLILLWVVAVSVPFCVAGVILKLAYRKTGLYNEFNSKITHPYNIDMTEKRFAGAIKTLCEKHTEITTYLREVKRLNRPLVSSEYDFFLDWDDDQQQKENVAFINSIRAKATGEQS